MSELTPKLSANTREYVGTNAFDNDKLDRKQLAEKLTGYLERLNDGAVLAIDAPWGEGKTWFGRNWNKDLNEKDFKTIYIDSFEQDYIEDPFILITSEILNVLKEDEADNIEELKRSGVEVAKRLLPIGIKASVNLLGRFIGSSDLVGEIKDAFEVSGDNTSDTQGTDDVGEAVEAGEKVALDLTNKWISDKLDGFVNDKIVMSEFKNQLQTYAESNNKPLVIFIDELDRCKPTFAVNLIERIKHFFDIPNIVFVLLLNREQLENAVQGVYGINTDASKYLDKFVNFYFRLPKQNKEDHRSEYRIENFINLTMEKYNFTKSRDDGFITWLKYWNEYFDLSLRDLEKCVALYAFAYPTNAAYLLAYFIVLKVKQPKLFSKLINNDIKAQNEAKLQMEEIIKIYMKENNVDENHVDKSLTLYYDLHDSYINNDFKNFDTKYSEYFRGVHVFSVKEFFKSLMNKIDINIER
jgi:mRNA-degrading endonuclease YafQ of YafQ-DinJ toxin-antitoxin module